MFKMITSDDVHEALRTGKERSPIQQVLKN